MLKVNIVLDNSRIFLFPASAQLIPGEDDNVNDHETPAPPADTTVRGEVVISTDKAVQIGPVRIVWEVARELKTRSGEWGARDVLARFESEVTTDDTRVEAGSTRLLFTFQVPSLLPPSSETVFDRTSHTLVASVLESVPEYDLGSVSAYDPSTPTISPRGSISSFADWSFPGSNASRRTSLMTESSGSRQSSRRSSFSSISGGSVSDNGSRRSSQVTECPVPKKKKGLLGGLLRKPATLLTSDSSTESHTRASGISHAVDLVKLPDFLLPSTAAFTKSLEIVSCPAPKSELCTVDWSKSSDTAGLGHSQKYVHSNLLSLGSGVNFEYKIDDIPANTTVHSIRLSLCQLTKGSHGSSEDEIFELFSRGCGLVAGGKMVSDAHVWRGEVSRTWDAQSTKSGKSGKSTGPINAIPQVSLPGVISGPSSLRIRTKARLPTPMVGAVPSSPKLLDNRLARVVHRLRVETFFSVLGEDESGLPLSPDPKSKNGKLQEGTLRRTWVDHEVTVGSCCITAENVLVPAYTASPERVLDEAQQRAKLQTRDSLSSFAMVKQCTQITTTAYGRRSTERMEKLPVDAKDRLARHSCETDSRCLCFHGDAVIAGMIGSLEKPSSDREDEILPLLVEIGGLVKSLYRPHNASVNCPTSSLNSSTSSTGQYQLVAA